SQITRMSRQGLQVYGVLTEVDALLPFPATPFTDFFVIDLQPIVSPRKSAYFSHLLVQQGRDFAPSINSPDTPNRRQTARDRLLPARKDAPPAPGRDSFPLVSKAEFVHIADAPVGSECF